MVQLNMILVVVGLALAIGAVMFGKQKKQRKTITTIAIIIGGVGLLAFVPMVSDTLPWLNQEIDLGLGGGTQTQVQVQTTQSTPSGLCAVEDTTVTVSAVNKYTAAAVGGNHAYKINDAPTLTVADTSTFTASPGDKLEILYGDAGGNYFGEVVMETIPCSGTVTYSADLVQNGTLTVEVFNEEGNLIDTAGENETLGAGDVVTLTAKLKGTYQRGFPYGGIIVVEYNNSDFDDVIVDFGGEKTSVPNLFTVSNTANTAKAYTIPAILSNQILEGSITFDVDDSNNPGNAYDPVLNFYPNGYYENEDTGGSFDGPAIEDEDDTAIVPTHLTQFTAHVD